MVANRFAARAPFALPSGSSALDALGLLGQVCRAKRCWGLRVSFHFAEQADFTAPFVTDNYFGDLGLAAPYLASHPDMPEWASRIINDDGGFFLGSEEAVRSLYEQTVGDDGPTRRNRYAGPVRVYAVTVSPDGRPVDENT